MLINVLIKTNALWALKYQNDHFDAFYHRFCLFLKPPKPLQNVCYWLNLEVVLSI